RRPREAREYLVGEWPQVRGIDRPRVPARGAGGSGRAAREQARAEPHCTSIPNAAFVSTPIAYVTPTAAATITTLISMRRLTSMPDRNASSADTSSAV